MWKIVTLLSTSLVTRSLSDKVLDLGGGSTHGQVQHLLVEVRLSMQEMEQIQEASVIVITLSCDTYTGTDRRERKELNIWAHGLGMQVVLSVSNNI